MNYPKAFTVKVKLLYPDNVALLKALEQGSPFVGKMLEQYSRESIGNEEILKAENLTELQTKAKAIKAKRELYKMWLSISLKQNVRTVSEEVTN